jgi:hypothetical protein
MALVAVRVLAFGALAAALIPLQFEFSGDDERDWLSTLGAHVFEQTGACVSTRPAHNGRAAHV